VNKGDVLFVRIDRKAREGKPSSEIFQAHLDYLTGIAAEREFYGGGFSDGPGGMILFRSADREDAERLCREDPIISSGFYEYDLYRWEILIDGPAGE